MKLRAPQCGRGIFSARKIYFYIRRFSSAQSDWAAFKRQGRIKI